MEAPVFRIFEKGDTNKFMELMKEIQPSIGGSRDPSMYRALCDEALLDNRVILAVAQDQSRIVGFTIGVIDRNLWRYSFMFRHPRFVARLALVRAFNRLLKLLKMAGAGMNNDQANAQTESPYVTTGSSNNAWKDSSSQIAKFLFEGVSETHRGKGMAKGLGEYFFKVCAERGAKRVDAVILGNNRNGLRLVYSLGFDIYRDGITYFATRQLP